MEKDRKEGIKGMANPGRYGIERVAYWLMRITGLGLLFYFIGHIYETSSLLDGKAAWNSMLELTQTTDCLLYTSPSPRDYAASRMPSSA